MKRPSNTPSMAGNRCANCGEVYLDHASQEQYTNASDALVLAKHQKANASRINK